MNSTKWPSLTEFAKHLGRESLCRVEENDKGIHISWIDNSPENLRRQDALRKKEMQDQGDEASEQRMIREQIRRAQSNREKEEEEEDRTLKRQEGEKITLSFGPKPAAKPENAEAEAGDARPAASEDQPAPDEAGSKDSQTPGAGPSKADTKPSSFGGISMKLGGKPATKNVFAQAKKNAFSASGAKKTPIEQPKKMSEAERIMKEEMERKRSRGSAGFGMPPGKKQKH
jgi:DNA/RNA-binding protein KIN17